MAAHAEVEKWIAMYIASTLGVPNTAINGETQLDDLGIDSITRAAFARELGNRYGCRIDLQKMMSCDTIRELATCVVALNRN